MLADKIIAIAMKEDEDYYAFTEKEIRDCGKDPDSLAWRAALKGVCPALLPEPYCNDEQLYFAWIGSNNVNETDSRSLAMVPERFVTRRMCLAAVKSYIQNLWHIPDAYMDVSLYVHALEGALIVSSLHMIHPRQMNHDICLTGVYWCPQDIGFVPACLKNRDIAIAAVSVGGEKMLERIPEEYRKDKSVLDALAGKWEPRHAINGIIAARILDSCPEMLELLPHAVLSADLCAIAVKKGGKQLLGHVPYQLMDDTERLLDLQYI